MRRATMVCLFALLGCSTAAAPSAPPQPPPPAPAASAPQDAAPADSAEIELLRKKIAQYAPVVITADVSGLPQSERDALRAIIEASRLLVPIFDRQSYAKNPELEQQLAADESELGKLRHAFWLIMRGPWDRLDHSPFAVDADKPKGSGYYPEDLTAAELDAYLAKNPGAAAELTSLYTIVKRDGDKLVGVPYSQEYAEWLKPAAEKLREAARATTNASLRRFLESRADAFSKDDYYQSDKDWMDLDSVVEVTIGPYEQYEDELKGVKTAFESFVTIADPAASKELAKYKDLLVDMQNNLPLPKEMKPARGKDSPIRVVDLVYSAGDARRGVMTIAFNLPNDERVRKEKGSKKVLLRNVIQKKFDAIMKPIGERILDPSLVPFLSSDGFFNEVLFHELSHALGPAQAKKGGKKVDINVALEELSFSLEEAKADVMGAYNVLYMVKKGVMPESMRKELLVSYFAGLFRSVRFGVDAHGRGAALQINRFLDEKAATFDAATGRFTIDFEQLERSIAKLVTDICTIQHEGDKEAAKALLDRYGAETPAIQQVRAAVADLPVDLMPTYPLAD